MSSIWHYELFEGNPLRGQELHVLNIVPIVAIFSADHDEQRERWLQRFCILLRSVVGIVPRQKVIQNAVFAVLGDSLLTVKSTGSSDYRTKYGGFSSASRAAPRPPPE